MIFRPNPAFDRFAAEGNLVGRILSGFGEIEIAVCRNAAHATLFGDTLMKALYAIRSTSSRIETAERLMQPRFEHHGIMGFHAAMAMVWHCLKIRNQYAHCNWGDNHEAGLFFADVQDSADTPDFTHSWRHVDVPLLEEQFRYFGLTMEMLEVTHHEMAFRMGQIQSHVWPMPICPTPAPQHNPLDEHVPPWIGEDEKALHLKRAAELKRANQQPERPPSVLRLTREEWAAKDAKESRLAAEKAAAECSDSAAPKYR